MNRLPIEEILEAARLECEKIIGACKIERDGRNPLKPWTLTGPRCPWCGQPVWGIPGLDARKFTGIQSVDGKAAYIVEIFMETANRVRSEMRTHYTAHERGSIEVKV